VVGEKCISNTFFFFLFLGWGRKAEKERTGLPVSDP
jgi:hypothetical protein